MAYIIMKAVRKINIHDIRAFRGQRQGGHRTDLGNSKTAEVIGDMTQQDKKSLRLRSKKEDTGEEELRL